MSVINNPFFVVPNLEVKIVKTNKLYPKKNLCEGDWMKTTIYLTPHPLDVPVSEFNTVKKTFSNLYDEKLNVFE